MELTSAAKRLLRLQRGLGANFATKLHCVAHLCLCSEAWNLRLCLQHGLCQFHRRASLRSSPPQRSKESSASTAWTQCQFRHKLHCVAHLCLCLCLYLCLCSEAWNLRLCLQHRLCQFHRRASLRSSPPQRSKESSAFTAWTQCQFCHGASLRSSPPQRSVHTPSAVHDYSTKVVVWLIEHEVICLMLYSCLQD